MPSIMLPARHPCHLGSGTFLQNHGLSDPFPLYMYTTVHEHGFLGDNSSGTDSQCPIPQNPTLYLLSGLHRTNTCTQSPLYIYGEETELLAFYLVCLNTMSACRAPSTRPWPPFLLAFTFEVNMEVAALQTDYTARLPLHLCCVSSWSKAQHLFLNSPEC